jgi:PKD repeat protein
VAGTFTASVTATNALGLTSQAMRTVTAAVNQPPIAKLALTSQPGPLAPTTARFDASGSTDPEGRPLSFTFTCGNGTKVGPQTSATATCSYPAGGTFKARVTVTDDAGNQANSAFITLVIASNQPPVANLTVTLSSKVAPTVATLDASGSRDPENGRLTYTYLCGNGAPDIGPTTSSSAQCTYPTSGTYTIRLTVTDAAGLSASTTTKLRL